VIAGTHPDDWLAWWTVGVTAKSSSARRTAFARALAIDSNQPAVLSSLAAIDLNEHRYEEALAFATKGMSFRQDVWGLAFEAFDADRALGHCADAALLAQVLKTRGPQNLRALVERVAPASVACKPIPMAATANPAPPALASP
jgi:Tfp pilus assembly protein PilF